MVRCLRIERGLLEHFFERIEQRQEKIISSSLVAVIRRKEREKKRRKKVRVFYLKIVPLTFQAKFNSCSLVNTPSKKTKKKNTKKKNRTSLS